MFKKFFLGIILAALSTYCVSSEIYEDLKTKNQSLKSENESLMDRLNDKGGNSEKYSVVNLQKELKS